MIINRKVVKIDVQYLEDGTLEDAVLAQAHSLSSEAVQKAKREGASKEELMSIMNKYYKHVTGHYMFIISYRKIKGSTIDDRARVFSENNKLYSKLVFNKKK